jgi:SAM-dependent methyltransferase
MNEQPNDSARAEAAADDPSSHEGAREGTGAREGSPGSVGGDARGGARAAKIDRRPWTLALKFVICAAASLTLLGGSLGFSLQQLGHNPGLDDSLRPLAEPAAQQPAAQRPAREADRIDRPVSEPYTGSLSIFEDPRRDEKLQVGRVMDVLKIREGSAVADIGAGSGWFTVRAAQRVGPRGAVFAVEINPQFVAHIERRARDERLPQVRAVLGKEDDPALPAASVDAVLILKTYHEIAEPVRLMRNLRNSLRPGALVGIIDRAGKGDDHGLDAAKVIAEAGRAGYALVEQHDFVKGDGMDYLLVFSVKG